MDVRKPTQNSQQPRQTNPKAKGVIQSKAGMWDFVSPKNEKRFESGIASSREIVIKAGPPPPSEPQPSVYQPSVNSMKPRQAGYQSPSGYPPKPQQAGYQSQAIYPPKPQQAGYHSSSGYPPSSIYPPKTQQASYQSSSIYPLKPQPRPQPQIRKPTLNSKQAHQTNPEAEGVIQTKAGIPQPSGYRSPSVFQPKPHQPWSPSKHQQHFVTEVEAMIIQELTYQLFHPILRALESLKSFWVVLEAITVLVAK
ncbi:hypothetical protein EYF80_048535 [Liparis tanakae]|uniref:Uncharacterized protein n=1 Tax=Liparis tanakae TaxID=230148 RepID=A0A4Z2FK14_9TELE|nr:hypothetical protein EYF80_048535 [Liparis tanakae]